MNGEPPTDLHAVADVLRGFERQPTSQIGTAASALVSELGRPANMRALFQSLVSDRAQLEVVAAHSFRHSNHFDKIALVDANVVKTYRLTLHLWRPPFSQDELDDDQIHNHRCDFWSTILFGALRAHEYERSAEGRGYTEVTYHSSRSVDGAKVNRYTPVGTSHLRHARSVHHAAGTTYHLPYHRIHRIVISPQTPTATLLLRGPYRTDFTSVFSNTVVYKDELLGPFDVLTLTDCIEFVRRNLP